MNLSRRQFFSAVIGSTIACKIGPIQSTPAESVLGWAELPGPKWEGYNPPPSPYAILRAENESTIECVKGDSSGWITAPHHIDWIVVG